MNKHIFKISPHYRKVTIWHGTRSGERTGVSTSTPNAGLTRQQRFDVVRERLAEFGIKTPAFK